MKIVIPTGAPYYRSALTLAKTLKKKGHEVNILSAEDRFKTLQKKFKSKYYNSIDFCPDPTFESKYFIKYLVSYCKKNNIDYIFPSQDAVASIIAFYKSDLPIEVPLPNYKIFQKAIDKLEVNLIAKKEKIPVPKTISEKKFSSADKKINKENISFPLVIKPRIRGDGPIRTKIVNSNKELKKVYKEFQSGGKNLPLYDYTRPMIQEYIRGRIFDCCTLSHKGEMIAGLTQERVLGCESHGGAGIINTTNKREEILDYSRRLLEALEWTGPAQIEWIYDSESKKFKLLEINPRFWGTLSLSILAGINFPLLTLKLLKNPESLKNKTYDYKEGITQRWPIKEITNVISDGKRKERILRLLDFKKWADPNIYTDFDRDDFKPKIYEITFKHFLSLMNILQD